MSVQLEPSGQLGFPRPLTTLVKRSLVVSNGNSQPVAFKVKTTAPKQYCVRPNSGRIEPGESVEVSVLLQPMKEDPAPDAKCRDKFLVQSVTITPEREGGSLTDLWSSIEKGDKSQDPIHEQKIRCAYLPASAAGASNGHGSPAQSGTDSAQPPAYAGNGSTERSPETKSPAINASDVPGYGSSDAAPSAFSTSTPGQSGFTSPGSNFSPTSPTLSEHAKEGAAAVGGVAAGAAAAVGLTGVADKIQSATAAPDEHVDATRSSLSSTARQLQEGTQGGTKQAVTPSINSETTRLQEELQRARSEIRDLEEKLRAAESGAATTGLRQRTNAGGSSSSAASTAQQQVAQVQNGGGVPLQIVAGLVFGTFVFTWLFF